MKKKQTKTTRQPEKKAAGTAKLYRQWKYAQVTLLASKRLSLTEIKNCLDASILALRRQIRECPEVNHDRMRVNVPDPEGFSQSVADPEGFTGRQERNITVCYS